LTKLSRREKHLLVGLAVALVLIVSVFAFLLVVGLPSTHRLVLLVNPSLQLAGATASVPFSVAAGQGTVCGDDISGNGSPQVCTTSSRTLPVNVGDIVEFTATPTAGYEFEYWSNGQCSGCDASPLYADIGTLPSSPSVCPTGLNSSSCLTSMTVTFTCTTSCNTQSSTAAASVSSTTASTTSTPTPEFPSELAVLLTAFLLTGLLLHRKKDNELDKAPT
jgi:hypothetical protein